jgi:PEGA domain
MDFLDPQKQKRHTIRLAIGYTLVGIVMILATTVLLYQAYGFGIDRRGQIIQNGLVFVTSRPSDANILVSGSSRQFQDQTNTRMTIPAGQYTMELTKKGYRNWKRALTVEGSRVERFDYPLLLPTVLHPTTVKQYATAPGLSTQSPDRRWLVTSLSDQNVFDLFDLNAKQPVARPLIVPAEVLAAGSTTKGWQAVEWSKNNRHVVLSRQYEQNGQAASEYILLDREEPDASQNLSVLFGFTPARLELRDRAHDRYYLFGQNSAELFTASLEAPTPQPYLSGVLAFTSEKDMVLYATTQNAPAGKTLIKMRQGDDPPQTVRQVSTSPVYPMDLAVYDDNVYIAAGAQTEDRVYVYKDPLGRLHDAPKEALVPAHILKVASPAQVSFSPLKRFVVAQWTDRFALYDVKTDRGYAYQAKLPPDAGAAPATWVDDFHLSYVSGGKVALFDYDGTNFQGLVSASPIFQSAFDRNYRYLYAITGQHTLTSTALLTEEDL